jgi:CRISPR-associated endonuclease/helicase Cas3
MDALAHSRNAEGQRHDLVAHLRAVSEKAAEFAQGFGGAEIAHYVGLWHDVGKLAPGFQEYLRRCEQDPSPGQRGPDHKAAGSLLARQHAGPAAFLVQGHHGGLRSRSDFDAWLHGLEGKSEVQDAIERARTLVPDLEPRDQLLPPADVRGDRLGWDFFLRLVFSALVDADHLDTEAHFDRGRAALRGGEVTMRELWQRFDEGRGRLVTPRDDPVGRMRQEVYAACLCGASHPPGLFRLTVPTGGGKTLSGMAFALRHAIEHGLRRVIVAVPFISITEQTADVYRSVLERVEDAHPVIIEHHSGGAADEGEGFTESEVRRRLAAENWDAPIIVTTTVQLLESLFAAGPSRCRKLHRLAQSVIVLDEAQALPSHLLTPILDALRRLCEQAGATVVLSTATQPAFDSVTAFANLSAREIVPQPERLFATLRRVRYEWRTEQTSTWEEIARIVAGVPQALAIVNTKRDALALLDALDDPDALHLSTLLCGAHRRAVIREVRRRLEERAACRLVSTQVVEAGVDIDFPLVVRALGPLDSVIQAAGRCNREGRREHGKVVIVRPADGGTPPGAYRTACGVTEALLGAGDLDPDDPADARRFFQRLFQTVDLDREEIQGVRERLDFAEVQRRFRMIDDDTEDVVMPYGGPGERRAVADALAQLRSGARSARVLMRRVRPYVVAVRRREVEAHRRSGLASEVMPGLLEWLGAYDPVRGLVGDSVDPESLIV